VRSLLPEKYHYYIYVFALIVLVIGMPVSKFLMSLSQIILVCNWLLEGNLKDKFNKFFKNKPAIVLSSLLLLHFIGLLYTTDFSYALKDIRVKVPLFVLPLVISTSRVLSKKIFHIILQFFVAAVVFGTIVSTFILTGIIHREVVDIRTISIFISHIRFALLICIAIFICGYFIYNELKMSRKYLWAVILAWLVIFLILMESVTGLSVLTATLFILLIYIIIKLKNKVVKWGSIAVIFIGIISLFYAIRLKMTEFSRKETIDFSKLDTYTSQGNLYEHNLKEKYTENGHYIWIYYCGKELEQSWNLRSRINFNNQDMKGNKIQVTLVRYLASKGLRKDADALNTLTDSEIKAVERGVVNVKYPNVSSLNGRLYEICWELELYKTSGDANGHSITQRFEYWKAAIGIINTHTLLGVGTGDVQYTFDNYYEKNNSPLLKKWRLRSHNQYLSIAVAFGIIGLLWFLITLFYPVIKQKMVFDYLYITFFIVTIISFFTEDTLETQAGVTFYAFFNSFFLFTRENNRVEE